MEPGDVLAGRYELETVLGHGAMAAVWRARDARSGALVAIKTLDVLGEDADEIAQRFGREAEAMKRIRSPRVCALYEVLSSPEDGVVLVLEHLDGETLAARMERPLALPFDALCQLGRELLEGLHAVHEAGVVHRDLKPANVFLTRGGAKIIDFGVAKIVGGSEPDAPSLTAEGASVGTFAFMAPEQIDSAQSADPRADLYAAGVVLFLALMRRLPFRADRLDVLVGLKLEQDPPTLASVAGRPYPESAEAFFQRALARGASRRFQTAGEMASAWERVCADPGVMPSAGLVAGSEDDGGTEPGRGRR